MERPILFSADMVNAIRDGRKTQTRRVVKEIFVYSLTDDYIHAILNVKKGCKDEKISTKGNPGFSKLGLHGWIGWTYILSDEIQRLWEEGVRGLVSIKRKHTEQKLCDRFTVSPKQESDEISPSSGVYGISRDAQSSIFTGAPFGWKPSEQQARKLEMGYTRGKLDGQKSSWKWHERGEASYGEIDGRGMLPFEVGVKDWTVQPVSGSASSRNVPEWNFKHSEKQIGTVLWVRETWKINTWTDDSEIAIKYKSDGSSKWVDDIEEISEYVMMKEYNRASNECDLAGVPFINERFDLSEYPDAIKWRPARFMYRWASRITLKNKRIWVERVQDISIEDICAEGLVSNLREHDACCELKDMWTELWNSIHTKENTMDDNPYVLCIEFEVVK